MKKSAFTLACLLSATLSIAGPETAFAQVIADIPFNQVNGLVQADCSANTLAPDPCDAPGVWSEQATLDVNQEAAILAAYNGGGTARFHAEIFHNLQTMAGTNARSKADWHLVLPGASASVGGTVMAMQTSTTTVIDVVLDLMDLVNLQAGDSIHYFGHAMAHVDMGTASIGSVHAIVMPQYTLSYIRIEY